MPADRAQVPIGAAGIAVHEVGVDVVRPLRHSVLRPGRPFATVCTPGDEDTATWHLAAFAAGKVVGVVTLFADATPYAKGHLAERFRWMAVDPGWQGRGVGRLLMRYAAELLGKRGVEMMWAHGRDSALTFYERFGFRVVGEGFIDPDTDIGHHYVIARVDDVARASNA